MAAAGDRLESARIRAVAAVDDYAAELRRVDGARLGEGLIETRALKDRVEAVFAEGLRRFDQSGEYAADGAIDLVAWLRSKCKLSGGAAAERVGIARQLQHLPQTSQAFATGELGYQHVAVLARTAEHLGAAVVRKAEASLLALAGTMDPGQFTGVAKNFEHRIDAQAALTEANRAHQRRYLTNSEPLDGLGRSAGAPAAATSAGSSARASSVRSAPGPAGRRRTAPGRRWRPGTGAAWRSTATGHRSGPTRITSSTRSTRDRRR